MADKANEIILELKAENKTLVAKIKETESAIKKLENSTKESSEGMGKAWEQVKHYAEIFLGVEMIKKIVEMASEIDSIETSFYNLASGAKEGAQGLIEAMTIAAKRTVDDTELMKQANSAIMTLGEEVADKLPKLMEIAFQTSKATGKSTEDAFAHMIVAVETGSATMLRKVGLNASAVSLEIRKYAQALGISASEMTEAEKKQAYLNAVLKVGEIAIKRNSEQSLTFGQKIQILTARMGEMKDNAVKALTPALENILDLWLKFTETTDKEESFLKLSSWAKIFAVLMNDVAMIIEKVQVYWRSFVFEMGLMADAYENIVNKQKPFVKTMTDLGKAMQDNHDNMKIDISEISTKYANLYVQIVDGGKKINSTQKEIAEKDKTDWETRLKREEARIQADIKYYTYIGELQKAQTLKEQLELAQTSRLNTNAIRDKELLEKAHQDKLDLYKENNEIKYYDYVGKLQESALLQEKHKFDELTQLLGASLQDREAMEKAYQDKKMLAEQQGNNKVKQSNLEVTRAKLKFDSMEYQSAKEVFANSAALMQSKNKFLFNLGKALSSASAIMNAAESITKIWAVWGECPPIAAAFSAISAAVTGVQINTIAATKLPSYQKGKLPVFAEGYYPADHFPAMIGAKEAVITAESTRANSGLIQEMFKNPGKSVGGGGVVVNQNNNFNGNVMSKDFVNSHVIPHLETVARYQGKQLFSEKNK